MKLWQTVNIIDVCIYKNVQRKICPPTSISKIIFEYINFLELFENIKEVINSEMQTYFYTSNVDNLYLIQNEISIKCYKN